MRATVRRPGTAAAGSLECPTAEQRAVDLIGIMNGLFYDRLSATAYAAHRWTQPRS